MKLARVTFLVIALAGALWSAKAQNDSALKFTLTEAQNYAIENFYQSKNSRLDIEAAKKLVWETTAIGLPHLSAKVDDQYIPGDIPTISFGEGAPSFPIAEKNTVSYSATLTQLIFSGEYIVGLQASKTFKLLSEHGYEKTTILIKENVAGTYYGILILRDNREILQKTLQNLLENLETAKKTFAVGMMEDTDVDQLELTCKRTDNQLKTIDNQVTYLERLLKFQLGLNLDAHVELTDIMVDLIGLNIVNDSTYQINLDENIDYKMLDTQEELMKLNMKREKSTFLPTLSSFYMYQDKTKKPAIDFTMKNIMGLSLSVPIFESGARMSRVGQARIELEKASNTKNQQSNAIILQAQQAKENYKTALEKYDNEKLNFELSERVYNKTTLKYKEGMVSSLDLSLINTQFLQAQLTYSAAVNELLNAKIVLDKAYNLL